MSAISCPFCPFAGCIWCEHKGGTDGAETPVPQAKTPEIDYNGSVDKSAPTRARQRSNRGLTTDSTPD